MLEKILDFISLNKNIFLHGPGGTGKTYTIKKIAEKYDKYSYLTATTGVAAVTIGGMTLHSYAGIGIGNDTDKNLLSRVMRNYGAKNRIIQTKILIIDEISMMGSSLFDTLDYIFRNVRRDQRPMGGIQIIICGDLLQLPPVKDGWIFESKAFQKCEFVRVEFKIPKRFDDIIYHNMLLRIRLGRPTKEDIEILNSRIKQPPDELVKPTRLYSTNVNVDYENKIEMEKLDETPFLFAAEDHYNTSNERQDEIFKKQLDQIIPKNIILKVGAQVMLKYNYLVSGGLVNGSRGVITHIEDGQYIDVLFKNGVTCSFEYHEWEVKEKGTKNSATREQIPFVPAYAITIHKSQSITLDYAVCDLSNVFEYGQAYVALSRIRNLEGLFLLGFDETGIKANKKVLHYLFMNDYRNIIIFGMYSDKSPFYKTPLDLVKYIHSLL